MRAVFAGLTMVSLLGCSDFQDALQTERKPTTPPGIAPIEDMAGVDESGAAGAANAGNGAPHAADKQPKKPTADKKKEDKSIIGKMTNEVFDMKKVMAANPNLVVVENKVSGSDPLSVAASAYISMRSRASMFGFQRALQLYKAQHERHPTHKELVKMMKENRVDFTMLPHYRMYAYDAETGKIMILEDKTKR